MRKKNQKKMNIMNIEERGNKPSDMISASTSERAPYSTPYIKYHDASSDEFDTPKIFSISRMRVSFSVMMADGVRKIVSEMKTTKYQDQTSSIMS